LRRAAYWIATSVALIVMLPSLSAQGSFPNCPTDPPPPLTINVQVSPSPSVFGQSVAVSVTTTGIAECGPATGFVQLVVDNSTDSDTILLDGNGNATINIPDPANGVNSPTTVFASTGSHTVGVNYGGCFSSGIRPGSNRLAPRAAPCVPNNYQAQAAGPPGTNPGANWVTTTVNQANTLTTVSAATNGTSLTAFVSVPAPGSGSPTGTVTFSNFGTAIGTSAVTNGQATLSISGSLLGLITASYSGDVDFLASNSLPYRLGPSPTSSLSLTSSLKTSTIGQPVTFTALLTVANGNGPATGTVQFFDGAKALGSPQPLAGGQASLTTSTLTVGSHAISATYSGDTQYPSAGASLGLVVNRVSTTLTVRSSPASPLSTQPITITVQLGPAPPAGLPSPTGSVTFSEGTTQFGAATVTAGAATITVGPLAGGPHQITAAYSGDADWAQGNSTITITVNAGPLTIVTQSLAEATVGVAYTAPAAPAMSASGGQVPLTWSMTAPSGLGITLASNGTFSGTPQTPGNVTVTIQVTDQQGTSVSKQYTLMVAAGALSITATLPGGTTGSPYSGKAAASGGTPPYTFSGSLPANLTIDPSSGAISGTPTVTGPTPITVTVTDKAGTTKSTTTTVTFALPAVPPLTISGGSNSGPGTQPGLQVNLAEPFPVPVTVTLTLTFKAAQGGGDNPEVQFAAGGRTISFTIPANSTAVFSPSPQLQTGTVAGTITITPALAVDGAPVTPAPSPIQIIISAAPPTISVTAVHTATGFTVTVTGFSTTLDMSQATFQFSGGSGTNLQTTSLTVSVGPLFSSFYQSDTPGPTGSQFVYTQPFTVNGGGTITSVTVTMSNSNGTSQAATATIQ
jgi:hypothetical protein